MYKTYFLLFFFLLGCAQGCLAQDEKSLFDELDGLLSRQQELTLEKERKIKIIKDGLSAPQITLEQAYAINSRLYDEYLAFKYDSAYKYVNKNLVIAKKLTNKHLYHESVLDLIHILSVAGLFDQAHNWVDSLKVEDLSKEELQDYYRACSDLYLFSSEFSVGTVLYQGNLEKAQQFRYKLSEAVSDPRSFCAVTNQADLIAWQGKNQEALKLLENYLKQHSNMGGGEIIVS